MINCKTYQMNDALKSTKVITSNFSGNNLVIKEEPPEYQCTEENDIDIPIDCEKCEIAEVNIDAAGLGNDEHCEGGVWIDVQIVKNEVLEVEVDIENEGVAGDLNIEKVGYQNIKRELFDEEDVKCEELNGTEYIKKEVVEDSESNESVDVAPTKCKRTHKEIQFKDMTLGKQNTQDKWRKHSTVNNGDLLNTYMLENNKKASGTLQISKHTSRYQKINKSNVNADSDNCTGINTDVYNSCSNHLKESFNYNDKYPIIKHISKRENKGKISEVSTCKLRQQGLSKTSVVNGKYSFKCDLCQKSYASKRQLSNHLRSHTEKKLFQCTICQQRFTHKSTFNVHFRIHTGEKPFECPVCLKSFSQNCSLTRHLKIHSDERSLKCGICKEKFFHKLDLKMHISKHRGEEIYKCSVCQQRFMKKSLLDVHLRSHTGKKPIECAICQLRFGLKDELNQHLKLHSNDKPFECAICQRRFSLKHHVSDHLKTHCNEKPFKCAICHRGFSLKVYLNKHLRVHNGDRPFECAICQRRFHRKDTMKKHLKTHSREKCAIAGEDPNNLDSSTC